MSGTQSRTRSEPIPAVAADDRSFVDRKRAQFADYESGELGNPWIVVGLCVVLAILVILVVYYNEFPAFDPTGLIGKHVTNSFITMGHGLIFYMFVMLSIVGSACALALSYTKNSDALLFMLVATVVMGLIFHFAMKSMTDGSLSFWLWAVLACILPLAASVYGFMGLRKLKKNYVPESEEMKAYNTRATASMIMLVATIIGLGGTVAGFVLLKPAFDAASAAA